RAEAVLARVDGLQELAAPGGEEYVELTRVVRHEDELVCDEVALVAERVRDRRDRRLVAARIALDRLGLRSDGRVNREADRLVGRAVRTCRRRQRESGDREQHRCERGGAVGGEEPLHELSPCPYGSPDAIRHDRRTNPG